MNNYFEQQRRAFEIMQEMQRKAVAEIEASGGKEVYSIHDEIVYDVPADKLKELAAKLTRST